MCHYIDAAIKIGKINVVILIIDLHSEIFDNRSSVMWIYCLKMIEIGEQFNKLKQILLLFIPQNQEKTTLKS